LRVKSSEYKKREHRYFHETGKTLKSDLKEFKEN